VLVVDHWGQNAVRIASGQLQIILTLEKGDIVYYASLGLKLKSSKIVEQAGESLEVYNRRLTQKYYRILRDPASNLNRH